MKKEILGKCMLLMSALIWGSSFIVMKNAVDFISPFTLLCIRFVLSTIFISILFFNKIKKIKKQDLLGGFLAGGNTITIGDIQAFIQYVRQFNQPIAQLAQTMNMLQSTAAAAERVFEFLEEEELEAETVKIETDEVEKLHGSVTFNQVNFGYLPEKTIIHDFNMHVHAGQTVAIVGPTGAGKTTIVKLLMRFYELNKGSIMIDGHDIKDFSRHDLRSLFGMVLQDTWLFNGTIKENLMYGKLDASDEEVKNACEMAYVDHFVNTLEDGYDTVLDEETSNISQGQKQLLTIARAFLKDPKILILDEATSSVDTRTEVLIQKGMEKLMEGRTSFVIAHRLSTIRDANTIIVMKDGDIVEIGNHDELLEKGGFYASLYQSQFEGSEICFFFFSKHVYIWYSTSRGDDVMVKRKPQYVKIKEYIIQNIEDEKYNENEQIESEHALCELFGVTRMTVRQALTELINENVIYSVPKVGSFVCKKSRFKSFDGLNSVTEDCAKKKEDCTSHVVLNELEEATDLMKKEMALEDNKVWHVKRVRLVNGEPLCFEDDYCNYDLTGDIPLEVSSTSLFNHFENDLNLHIAFSDQQIDAVLAGEELGKYLQVDPVTPLLRVLSITCLHNGKCIEYGYTYYRVDKYTFNQVAYRRK